MTVNKEKYRVP